MRKYGKWVLTLGLAAATPSVATADGLLPSIFKPKAKQTSAATAGKSRNQQTAEAIAQGMRKARLAGYDIQIKYDGGVATLNGQVKTAEQRARATKVAESVSGVQVVVNRMAVADAPQTAARRTAPAPRTPQARPAQPTSPIQLTSAEFVQPPAPAPAPAAAAAPATQAPAQQTSAAPAGSNQKTAEGIAQAMASAGLSGYDIQIRFKGGVCTLEGVVGSPTHRAVAQQVASSVSGVKQVQNRLGILQQVQPVAHQQPGGPMHPAAMYQQQGGPINPAAMYQQGAPQQPMQAPGAAMPVGLHGAGSPVYNMPNLPSHSWPTYANYPNYSQVTYPNQYSASAWPYIGPYYPYPQVPLGWRKAQLEWDDGYWNLNFNPRTDRWWWFLQPKNW